ncbi:MAG: toll/interleukin-1 receptor domain-containing protein, partial [Firmicutes bacterium]|nr:toll/interleukin-1 receptor domain-containing protein [Bacillota bacterium]
MTKCIYCGSENIYYSKKRGVYICEDCEKSFTPEEEVFHSRRIFLSYGHDENAELVKLIYDRLKERGHDPWIDYAKIKTGNDWRENITQGILGSNGFLAFLSKYSVRVPGVCLDEISIGVGNYNCRINSILLEKNVVPPNSISNIQYLDMSDWKEIKA